MKKYLVVLSLDVADEGDVGLIELVTEKELKEIKSVDVGFGNIEEEPYEFSKSSAKLITDEEIKVLKKFKLLNRTFGYCNLSTEELEEDE
jgi:hypothetical protein